MPATSFQPEPPEPSAGVDPDRGLGLLFSFLVAASIAVAAVMLTVAVDQMWILVPAMAIHLSVTLVVLMGIFKLLKD